MPAVAGNSAIVGEWSERADGALREIRGGELAAHPKSVRRL